MKGKVNTLAERAIGVPCEQAPEKFKITCLENALATTARDRAATPLTGPLGGSSFSAIASNVEV